MNKEDSDQWTREQKQLLKMHKALYSGDVRDRLYVSRKEGGRGLRSIENSMDAFIRGLDDIKKSKESLIKAASNNTGKVRTNKTMKIRKQKWEEKLLYGYFKQQTGEILRKKNRKWP